METKTKNMSPQEVRFVSFPLCFDNSHTCYTSSNSGKGTESSLNRIWKTLCWITWRVRKRNSKVTNPPIPLSFCSAYKTSRLLVATTRVYKHKEPVWLFDTSAFANWCYKAKCSCCKEAQQWWKYDGGVKHVNLSKRVYFIGVYLYCLVACFSFLFSSKM